MSDLPRYNDYQDALRSRPRTTDEELRRDFIRHAWPTYLLLAVGAFGFGCSLLFAAVFWEREGPEDGEQRPLWRMLSGEHGVAGVVGGVIMIVAMSAYVWYGGITGVVKDFIRGDHPPRK